MKEFLLIYQGGDCHWMETWSPEKQQEVMAQWGAWFKELEADVFGQLQILGSEDACEDGDETPRLPAEEGFDALVFQIGQTPPGVPGDERNRVRCLSRRSSSRTPF